jgi:hypothetical protein
MTDRVDMFVAGRYTGAMSPENAQLWEIAYNTSCFPAIFMFLATRQLKTKSTLMKIDNM